jgi:hypothetical protein
MPARMGADRADTFRLAGIWATRLASGCALTRAGGRPLFAFASYNAPRQTSREGPALDADGWFNNLEVVVAKKVGQETMTCVRNVYKFYVSYQLTMGCNRWGALAAPCDSSG